MKRLLLVDLDRGRADAVRARPPIGAEVVDATAANVLDRLREDHEVAAAVLGTSTLHPVQLAQRSHAIDPKSAVLILAEPSRVAEMQQALMFAPYIGDLTICRAPATNDDLVTEVNGLVDLAERRRRLGGILRAADLRLEGKADAPSAPSYLGALLDLAPIGVIALDPDGAVTAMNRCATTLFGIDEKDALGTPFARLVCAEDASVLAALLASGSGQQGLFRGTAKRPDRIVEITVSKTEHRRDRRGFLVVAQDVTERTSLLERLERAVRTRDEFLSAASHELKTPIAALRLNAQHAARLGSRAGDDRLNVVAKRLDAATARIAEQIDYLLDVTRLANGLFSLERTETDLARVAREVLDALADSAREAGCSIEARIPERVIGHWDGKRIEQVLTNLLINAIKFGRGRPIELTIIDSESAATVTVRDFGIGIDSADQERIFEQFERGVDSHTHGGWGLGLWISTRIVDAHGGSLAVESSLGEGSTFTALLPKTA